MARKKKETYKTKAEKLVKKQQKRIENLRKRGYILGDVKPLPKRVDRKVYERLQRNLTLESLYEQATYRDEDTGKLISGKKRREQERTERAKKAAKTRKIKKSYPATPDYYGVIIAGIRQQIQNIEGSFITEYNRAPLEELFERVIARDGEIAVAQRLVGAEEDAMFLIGKILQPSPRGNDVQVAMTKFAKLIKGEKLSQDEEDVFAEYVEDMDVWQDWD